MSAYVATSLSYVFNPAAGTISFAGQPGFNPLFVKAITDQTRNAFIYLPGITNFGGTWDSTGTVLTLQASVSSYAATDLLLIQYDDQGNALADIQNILQGVNVLNYQPVMNRAPGAAVFDNITNDSIKSLIAEVRMNSMVFCMLAREEIDLNALKRNILDQASA